MPLPRRSISREHEALVRDTLLLKLEVPSGAHRDIWEVLMLNFSYEEALKNFSSLVDNVVSEHAVVSVSRSPRESVVMISKDDYDSIRQSSPRPATDTLWGSSPAPSAALLPHAHNSLDDWF
ncbi:hypothetical protein CQ017_01845 [Arthrobacter sp. MYb224]|nr:hypothetical protein CQ017_01845 [Arthrobacter sp. MYb224]